jgi:hypothetical protein
VKDSDNSSIQKAYFSCRVLLRIRQHHDVAMRGGHIYIIVITADVICGVVDVNPRMAIEMFTEDHQLKAVLITELNAIRRCQAFFFKTGKQVVLELEDKSLCIKRTIALTNCPDSHNVTRTFTARLPSREDSQWGRYK